MSPPITYKTVVGTYTAPDGTPVAAPLRFIPSKTVYDAAGSVVIPPLPILVSADAFGYFEVELGCTDVAGTTPVGWVWQMTELFPGGREIEFQLPSAGGSTVPLSSLLPVDAVDVTYAYASQASISSLQARVTAIEAFDFTAYQLHPYLLMGS